MLEGPSMSQIRSIVVIFELIHILKFIYLNIGKLSIMLNQCFRLKSSSNSTTLYSKIERIYFSSSTNYFMGIQEAKEND